MAIFLGHGSRHEGAISPTLSMGYDTVPKGQWRAREQAMVRRGWRGYVVQDKDKVERDKVYDRG